MYPNAHIVSRGSIPAGAGEPPSKAAKRTTLQVYPRGCGGALLIGLLAVNIIGLSPRVRGSRRVSGQRRHAGRSIPAGAGEPDDDDRPFTSLAVYPRGCGGASVGIPIRCRTLGLSPRVRGSPSTACRRFDVAGSIPAGAGEPKGRRARTQSRSVYPRGCGGATARVFARAGMAGLSPRVPGEPHIFS